MSLFVFPTNVSKKSDSGTSSSSNPSQSKNPLFIFNPPSSSPSVPIQTPTKPALIHNGIQTDLSSLSSSSTSKPQSSSKIVFSFPSVTPSYTPEKASSTDDEWSLDAYLSSSKQTTFDSSYELSSSQPSPNVSNKFQTPKNKKSRSARKLIVPNSPLILSSERRTRSGRKRPSVTVPEPKQIKKRMRGRPRKVHSPLVSQPSTPPSPSSPSSTFSSSLQDSSDLVKNFVANDTDHSLTDYLKIQHILSPDDPTSFLSHRNSQNKIQAQLLAGVDQPPVDISFIPIPSISNFM